MKQGNLVWRLMRKNISVWQIAGYAIANFIGLSIVLTALQFYRDSTAGPADENDAFINNDYLIVSKRVSEIGSLVGSSYAFSEEEIEDLRAQPWVKSVGAFTPAFFQVSGKMNLGARPVTTHLFFESIPDEFFDVRPEGWGFNPADPEPVIPIIISKDYLTLYNFGFAASQGTPQISEETITRIPIYLSLSGNGRQQEFEGKVVGFSSRLNTIAVPDDFLQWANEKFGDDSGFTSHEISRLIINTSNPGDPAIRNYFEEHNIDISTDKLNAGRAAYFLSIVSAVVIAIGVAISVLSFFILMLSIFLLLQKNKEKMRDLMVLGYTPRQTAANYYRLVAIVNTSIYAASIVVMLIASEIWKPMLTEIGLQTVDVVPTVIIGFIVMALITAINFLAIRRIVKRNF